MRLYNAASCTPFCSTSDASRKPQPKQHSFVPMTTTSINNDESPIQLRVHSVENTTGDDTNMAHGEHQARSALGNRLGATKPSLQQQHSKPSHKFQYLFKSNSTSTTGGKTPPHDNTSPNYFSNHQEYIHCEEEKEEVMNNNGRIRRTSVASVQIELRRDLQTHQPLQEGIRPIFHDSGHCINDYYYGKPLPSKNKLNGLSRHPHAGATDDDTVESSCSTLTTTRSMRLQQDECAVTMSSLPVPKKGKASTGVTTYFPYLEAGFATQEIPMKTPGVASGRKTTSKNDNVDNREESSPPISLAGTTDSSKNAPNTSVLVTKAAGQNHKSELNQDLNNSSTEDFAAVRAQLRKVSINSTSQPEDGRVDFFPKQKPVVPENNISIRPGRDNPAPARLGVTSRFPSSLRVEIPQQESEEFWDPLHDHKEDLEAWAHFDDEMGTHMEETMMPTLSHTSDESPFPFDMMDQDDFDGNDASFTALLGSDGAREAQRDMLLDREALVKSQGHKKSTDARKSLTSRGGNNGQQRRPPRREISQKPKLLGPLLEARFTRSYWRRLKRTKKDSNHMKGEDLVSATNNSDSSKASAKITGEQDFLQNDNVDHDPDIEDHWWEPRAPGPASVDDSVSGTPENMFESKPIQDDGEMTTRILGPRRRQECELILGTIGLTLDELVTAIDTADASYGLTEDQIVSLQSMIPTSAEKASLLKPPLDLAQGQAEELMMQMVGIPELEKKLEALLFQNQFPVSIDRLCNDLSLFQKACKEVLSSSKLDKVLGIVNLLGNRLVGKTPGKKKTSKVSAHSLIDMLDEVNSFPDSAGVSYSQPFLSYARERIQKTNPSLLDLKEDMPSLPMVALQFDMDTILTDLEQLETKLEDFRKFALFLCAAPTGRSVDTPRISIDDEVSVLETTTIGSFVMEFYLKFDELYPSVDATQGYCQTMCSHFSDDDKNVDKLEIGTVLGALSRFCDFAERKC